MIQVTAFDLLVALTLLAIILFVVAILSYQQGKIDAYRDVEENPPRARRSTRQNRPSVNGRN